MKQYSDQFFADLAQLIHHGPEPFEQLVKDLSDPDRRKDLIEALVHLSRVASETAPRAHSRSGSASPFSYDDIQTPQVTCTDPEVVEMLDTIRERLTTASTLRSRRALVDLAYDLDVPLAKRDSMPRMVQKMLTTLATRDAEDIAIALNRVKEADRGSTESFMELASFITRNS